MLRIYARVLAAALVAIAVAAAVGIPGWGLVAGVPYYLGSAAVFAYAGFGGGDAWVVRSVVAALAMGVLGFPFGGRGWEVGLAHAAFGGLTMACAVLLPCADDE